MRFHHIGLACKTLDPEVRAHSQLGYVAEGAIFEDPIQKVRGCFMTHGAFRIELLEPLADESPLTPYLRRGVKLYHQAFEVDDLGAAIAAQKSNGAMLCAPPAPAVAFAGRPIAFIFQRTQSLIELIQAPTNPLRDRES